MRVCTALILGLMMLSLPMAMAGPGGTGGPSGGGNNPGYVLDQDLSSDLIIGNIAMRDVLSTPSGDLLFVGVQTGDSYIGGQFLESGGGQYNSFIGRYNMSTGLQWARVLSSSCTNDIQNLELTSSGRVVFLGTLEGCPVKTNITVDNTTVESGGSSMIIGSFNEQGNIQWLTSTVGSPEPAGFSTDDYGNIYISGTFTGSFSYSNLSFSGYSTQRSTGFIFSLDGTGTARWKHSFQSRENGNIGYATMVMQSATNSDGLTLVAGSMCKTRTSSLCTLDFGSHEVVNGDDVGEQDFLAAIDKDGGWQWADEFGGTGLEMVHDVEAADGGFLIVGYHAPNSEFLGQSVSESGIYILGVDGDGNHIWSEVHSDSDVGTSTEFYSVHAGKNGSFFVGGKVGTVNPFPGSGIIGTTGEEAFIAGFNNQGEWMWSSEQEKYFTSPGMRLAWDNDGNISVALDSELWVFSRDKDADGYGWLRDKVPLNPSQYADLDGDGYGDNPLGTQADDCPTIRGTSTINEFGCRDSDRDGWSDSGDDFPNDPDSWSDSDGDGHPDQGAESDEVDDCPNTFGTSYKFQYGCADDDGDGYSNEHDAFSSIPSQWEDFDKDGYGDNQNGFEPDSCPLESGYSFEDVYGCVDTDEDGWSDRGDDLPEDPLHHSDMDGDGIGDGIDAFPSDGTQYEDADEDGHGDNPLGMSADLFPNDSSQWADSDGDGRGDNPVGSNPDAFPFNPTQYIDSDGDGWGDNTSGLQADAFPDDATQWMDIDGDGCGDNPAGTTPDAFPQDFTQCTDRDGDGWGDNAFGGLADIFPDDPSEWMDGDGDGIGDNSDQHPDDFDNDGYNDSTDPLPKLATPGDLDGDGCLDEDDEFPADSKECRDSDGDGEGDNADTDDDNDGWADTDEIRHGTNQFSSAEQPVDSFEIVVPGTAIGLGAWDIIGMFGGIPLIIWITFGLITRNGRTRGFEEKLFTASSEQELANISDAYEFSLMWRLIGPHQALRLERIRSNLEVKFSRGNIDDFAEMDSTLPDASLIGVVGTDGYEWLEHGGYDWYRQYNHEQWTRWQ